MIMQDNLNRELFSMSYTVVTERINLDNPSFKEGLKQNTIKMVETEREQSIDVWGVSILPAFNVKGDDTKIGLNVEVIFNIK